MTGRQSFYDCLRRNLRRSSIILSVFFLSLLRGRGAETPQSETNLIPENTPLWTETMLWDKEVRLSSGVGYNGNVLLSPFNPRGSGFFVNGLDLIVMRMPMDGWQVVGSLLGDDTRYWHNVGASGEDSFIASLRVQRDLPNGWEAALEARGLFENQVLDISTSQGVPATALVEGFSVTARPSVRKDFKSALWLQLEIPVTRWYFKTPLDDYWEVGPVATLGHNFGERSDVTLGYSAQYQPHDQWFALNAYGQPLKQRLVIMQQRAELAWHQYWDSHRRWRSSTRLIFAYKEDNGGGYFNYYQYQVVQDLRWKTAGWDIKGSAQMAYEDYPVQGTGTLNGQTLYRNLLNLSLEMERRLSKGLKSYAKLEYQRAFSNEAANAGKYTGTTVAGGLRWEF